MASVNRGNHARAALRRDGPEFAYAVPIFFYCCMLSAFGVPPENVKRAWLLSDDTFKSTVQALKTCAQNKYSAALNFDITSAARLSGFTAMPNFVERLPSSWPANYLLAVLLLASVPAQMRIAATKCKSVGAQLTMLATRPGWGRLFDNNGKVDPDHLERVRDAMQLYFFGVPAAQV